MKPSKEGFEYWAHRQNWLLLLEAKGHAHYLTPAGFTVEVQFDGDKVGRIINLDVAQQ